MTDTTGSAPPAGNPPAGGEGTPPAATTPPAGGDGAWYAGFEDAALRGLAESKQWKGPQDALASYRQLEQHMGVPPERLIKLPEAADAPEWNQIKQRLGFAAPEKAEDYGITAPEGADPTFATAASKWMHEVGMPKDMAIKLSEKWNGWASEMDKQQTEARQAEDQAQLTSLKNEWGVQFDQSAEMAKRAAAELGNVTGVTADELNAMEGALGTAKFLKLFAAIGSKNLQEAPMLGTDGAGAGRQGFMSPDVARAQIEQLKNDPEFGAAMLKEMESTTGTGPRRARWEQLHKIATGAGAG